MRNLKQTLTACLLFMILTAGAQSPGSSLTLAHTLQSNMVVQQLQPLQLWGSAGAGSVVKVTADWLTMPLSGHADQSGHWLVSVPVPAAPRGVFLPHEVRIESQGDTVTLKNILIGEVWLCSGQSNMDMPIKPILPWMQGALNFEREIAAAQFPAIRLYDVPTDFKAQPQGDCGGQWVVCTPVTAPDFSAAAFFFGRELLQTLQVPVGLVVSSVGASTAQAWTSRDTLKGDANLYRQFLIPYDTSARSREVLDSTVTFDKVARPTLLYNAMIYPLRRLGIRGAIWYQGESNRYDSTGYTRLQRALIHNWRRLFGQDSLPFYFVQVAPYTWQENNPAAYDYALLRQAQAAVRDAEPATGMVVTTDICDPADIHPRDKQAVGWRLAGLALHNTYGLRDVQARGPQYERIQQNGAVLSVYFKEGSLGRGLTTSDGKAPACFFVAGKDRVFYPAEARIAGNHVEVRAAAVKAPVAVRYAFTNYPVTNFQNKDGWPAEPFRSDHW